MVAGLVLSSTPWRHKVVVMSRISSTPKCWRSSCCRPFLHRCAAFPPRSTATRSERLSRHLATHPSPAPVSWLCQRSSSSVPEECTPLHEDTAAAAPHFEIVLSPTSAADGPPAALPVKTTAAKTVRDIPANHVVAACSSTSETLSQSVAALGKGGKCKTPLDQDWALFRLREEKECTNLFAQDILTSPRSSTSVSMDVSNPPISLCPFSLLSKTHQDHFRHLQHVLERCAKTLFTASPLTAGARDDICSAAAAHLRCSQETVGSCLRSQEAVLQKGSKKKKEKPPVESDVLVACIVALHPSMATPASVTGVNYKAHQLLHEAPHRPFRGLLKGCAEQNAFGAAAAAGCHYAEDIHSVYLLAARLTRFPMESHEGSPLHASQKGLQLHSPVPCAECWRYLCDIHRQKRATGSERSGLNLYLFLSPDTLTEALLKVPLLSSPFLLSGSKMRHSREEENKYLDHPQRDKTGGERKDSSAKAGRVLAERLLDIPDGMHIHLVLPESE